MVLCYLIPLQRVPTSSPRKQTYQPTTTTKITKKSISRLRQFLNFNFNLLSRPHSLSSSLPRSQVEIAAIQPPPLPPSDTQNWKEPETKFDNLSESRVKFRVHAHAHKPSKTQNFPIHRENLQAITFLIIGQTVHWTKFSAVYTATHSLSVDVCTRMNYFYGHININSR